VTATISSYGLEIKRKFTVESVRANNLPGTIKIREQCAKIVTGDEDLVEENQKGNKLQMTGK